MNNFHTHTKRCNHAEGIEEDYVLAAIKAGYKRLGFTGHMPLPPEDKEWSYRMSPFEMDEYVEEVLRLKDVYANQIEIFLSFEFDYFDNRTEWADHLIEKYPLDFTIAGNHFYNKVASDNYFGRFDENKILEKYLETAILILESNKFDIFAHPDLFMCSYPKWDKDAKAISKTICELALKHDVILEYNLAGIKDGRQYPNNHFWDLAIEMGNKIIVGVDAHSPKDFSLGHHQKAIDMLSSKGANLLLDLDI